MNLTTRELRLAKKAASKFLPATLEDFIPTATRKSLPLGVFKHGNRFRIAIKQPDGKWQYLTFETPEEAVEAREKALNPQPH